jgi:nicotinic acid mononucleotide adenylyltransferase
MTKIEQSAERDEAVPIEKISSQLESLHETEPRRWGVLVMSGSFGPVHTQHIRAMEAVRIALQHAGWIIVGGFLAPSHDQYVQSKGTTGAFSFRRRTELCRLATQQSDWLDVCSLGEFRTHRVCTTVREQVERQCTALLRGHGIWGIEVMGSDTAIRIMEDLIAEWESTNCTECEPWYRGRVVCCVIRPGPDSAAHSERLVSFIIPRTAAMDITIILVDGEREGLPLKAISSTQIRSLMATHDWDELRAREWLHPQVLRSLEAFHG